MSPEVTAAVRAAYVEAIPALAAIESALTAARDDDDAEDRRREITVELAYARICERCVKREKAVEVVCDRRLTHRHQPTRAGVEQAVIQRAESLAEKVGIGKKVKESA